MVEGADRATQEEMLRLVREFEQLIAAAERRAREPWRR